MTNSPQGRPRLPGRADLAAWATAGSGEFSNGRGTLGDLTAFVAVADHRSFRGVDCGKVGLDQPVRTETGEIERRETILVAGANRFAAEPEATSRALGTLTDRIAGTVPIRTPIDLVDQDARRLVLTPKGAAGTSSGDRPPPSTTPATNEKSAVGATSVRCITRN